MPALKLTALSKETTVPRYSGSVTHSLHRAVPLPHQSDPELVAAMLEQYSRKGDIVLDPFLGSGTVALETALMRRVAYGSDIDPLAVAIARAKLNPVDIAEVTLALSQIQLTQLVDIKHFDEFFSPFYDIETFREIFALRNWLRKIDRDKLGQSALFIELIALSLLHGHTAGFLSGYSLPQLSVSPFEQEQLNHKRGTNPVYRAIIPRILRRAASVLRDGIPSSLSAYGKKSVLSIADAKELFYVSPMEVDLLLTAPPLPKQLYSSTDFWLRRWFAEAGAPQAEAVFSADICEKWVSKISEYCQTFLPRVKVGGYLAFIVNSDVGLVNKLAHAIRSAFTPQLRLEALHGKEIPKVAIKRGINSLSEYSHVVVFKKVRSRR